MREYIAIEKDIANVMQDLFVFLTDIQGFFWKMGDYILFDSEENENKFYWCLQNIIELSEKEAVVLDKLDDYNKSNSKELKAIKNQL